MTDISDQATEREERFRDAALTAQAAKPAMSFKGECYNCGAPIESGCFCDTDCRDDYELREKQKRV